MSDVGQFREVCYEIDLLYLSPNYTFKSVYNGECRINNEVKFRFMKCLGINSYLGELFLATNCNFHCKRSPSRVARELSNVSTVRSRFPMLTINKI